MGGHRVLGEGGMGIVYEADQQRQRRPAALNVVRAGEARLDAEWIGSDGFEVISELPRLSLEHAVQMVTHGH